MSFSPEQIRLEVDRSLWERGELDHLRHDGQSLLAKAVRESSQRITVLHAARGYGKTFDALLDHFEYGFKNPGTRQVFAAINRDETKKILQAVAPMVLKTCPQDIRPDWVSTDHAFRWKNSDSVLYIEGVDGEGDRGDHLRGPHIHKFSGDEVGFWRDPVYVYRTVILPQLQRVGGKGRLQSTSPKSVGHGFVSLCEEAMRRGSYHKFTVWDNPRLTKEQIQADAEEISGLSGEEVWKATAVRRELLCEFVTEAERQVIPEFRDSLHVIDSYERPEYVDTYVFMDLGLVDLTHVLFCYWDFDRAVLVVEDEIASQYLKTSELAERVKEKERELWSGVIGYGVTSTSAWNRTPYGRYSDNDAQLLFDLSGMGLHFSPAMKVEKETALHRLRTAFASGRIAVHERCQVLLHQLRTGMWNERRTDYERDPANPMTGHLDGIDALIYGWRMMDHKRNPIPYLLGVSRAEHHTPPIIQKRAGKSDMARAIEAMVRKR